MGNNKKIVYRVKVFSEDFKSSITYEAISINYLSEQKIELLLTKGEKAILFLGNKFTEITIEIEKSKV